MAAQVIITFKIMPSSPEIDLKKIEKDAGKVLSKVGVIAKVETNPIAFGLKELLIYLVSDEAKGSPDEAEKELSKIKGVESVEIVDVRRTVEDEVKKFNK
ncbi:Elongation factor 1-beta [Candidatus Tiddalikarchaeum anstoanum]|nr:Elongation factor 1-beta [Candidatus Tiddalikarchaeum anstoanum]